MSATTAAIGPFVSRVTRNRIFHLSAAIITAFAALILCILWQDSSPIQILTRNLPVYLACLLSTAIFTDLLENVKVPTK